MNNWKEITLKEITEKVIDNRGKTPPVIGNGYEILEVNSISQDKREPDYSKVTKFVDRYTYNSWFRNGHVKEDDILVPTVGTIGNVSFSKQNRGSIAQNLIALRVKKDYDSLFIYYKLKSPAFKKQILNLDIGGVQPSVKVPHLLAQKILLPSLKEQKEIAGVLSSLDDKIELLREQNKTLETTAQTIFKEWFVNFNFPDKNGKPYKDAGGKMINSESGEIPEGWSVGKYEDLVNVVTGKGIKKENLKNNGLYRVVGANGEIGRTDKYLFDENVILTGRVGTLGTVYISRGKVWISDNVLISKAIAEENFYLAYFYLKIFNFGSLNCGSTQPLITQTSLKNVKALLPNRGILKEWHNFASKTFNKIDLNNSQIKTLSKLRDTLLPKLMNGEARVVGFKD